MSKPVALITGANGEIGRSLITRLADEGRYDVVTLDLVPIAEPYRAKCLASYAGNIMDKYLLDEIVARIKARNDEIVGHGRTNSERQGDLDEAIPWFQKAMQATRYESPAFPHLNLGRVYERQGKWSEAIDCYKQALALNPDYALAKKALGRLISSLN